LTDPFARCGADIAGVNIGVEKSAPVVGKNNKPRPFGAVLRDLLIERGITTGIGNPDWVAFARALPDVSYESLRKAVTGERPAGIKIMQSVAAALGVYPDVFWEYQLAQVQRSFNPSEVGEEVAFANLQAWLERSDKG
jgi:hypothetical protein